MALSAGSGSEFIGAAEFATRVADESHAWYSKAAIRSRRWYRSAEISTLVVSASIPISAVVYPESGTLPALLGSAIVVITGLRSIFHWQENYIRFSRAREMVDAERRRYRMRVDLYANEISRDAALVAEVTRIEQEEMGQWVEIAVRRPAEASEGVSSDS